MKISTDFLIETNSQIKSAKISFRSIKYTKSISTDHTSIKEKNKEELQILDDQKEEKQKQQDEFNYINNLERYIKPRKQLILMLVYVIIAFYFFLFPLKLWNILCMFICHKKFFTKLIKLRQYWYINITARAFFYINSSINVLLYYRFSTKFRYGFRRLMLFKSKTQCEEKHEIEKF